jgi:hypothetical protein
LHQAVTGLKATPNGTNSPRGPMPAADYSEGPELYQIAQSILRFYTSGLFWNLHPPKLELPPFTCRTGALWRHDFAFWRWGFCPPRA